MTPPNPVGAVTERPWRVIEEPSRNTKRALRIIGHNNPARIAEISIQRNINADGPSEIERANAAYIIRCVNEREELIALLELAFETISRSPQVGTQPVIDTLHAALSKARGETL